MRDKLGRFIKGSHWRKPQQFRDKDWLVRHYVSLKESTGDIAKSFGVTDAAIIFWLRKHGIARRTVSQAREIKHWGQYGINNPMHGKLGPLNPRYIDGGSPERQRLYAQGAGKEFVLGVLKRDGRRCRKCGSAKKTPRGLHVHHVGAWATWPDLRFAQDNAVTLCKTCHDWVHSKKNVHKEFIK